MDAIMAAKEAEGLKEIQEALDRGIGIYQKMDTFGQNERDQSNLDFLIKLRNDPELCSQVFRAVRAVDTLIYRMKQMEAMEQMLAMSTPIPEGKAN